MTNPQPWAEGDRMISDALAYLAQLYEPLSLPRPSTSGPEWLAVEELIERAYEDRDSGALQATLKDYIRHAYGQWNCVAEVVAALEGTIVDVSHPDATAAGDCPHCGGTYSLDAGRSPITAGAMRQCAFSRCGWRFTVEDAPMP